MSALKIVLATLLGLAITPAHANPATSTPTVRVESVKSGAEAAAELSKQEKNKTEAKSSDQAPDKLKDKPKVAKKAAKSKGKTLKPQPKRGKAKSR